MKAKIGARLFALLFCALLPSTAWAQSMNASVSGTVTDPAGAVVPNVELTLTSVATGSIAKATSGPDGLYSFPNLTPGTYELKATAQGFRDFVQKGITVSVNMAARVDVKLELGTAVQTVEVSASVSPLETTTGERKEGVSPETIKQLPLIISGRVRSSADFAVLMPGVSTGGRGNAFDARINGGIQSGDEAVLDGVSMQQGMMNQTGMISIQSDFPLSPDMVSEIKVLTSNYAPEYGATNSAQIVAITKSGTNDFHGGVYEYHRNTALNARRFGADKRSKDLEHDFGAFLGGPLKIGNRGIPLFWSGRKKSYFYINLEGFRIRGGVQQPTISVPTVAERNGDFRDWKDKKTGQLIPIFDPATTRVVGGRIVRDQFMGCDGNTPNVICPSDPRLQNSLAKRWFKFLPEPNLPGVVNNFLVPVPVPDVLLAHANYLTVRGDQYIGEKDHVSVTVWYQGAAPNFNSLLPIQLATERITEPQFSFVDRANWDHTISPTLLNHFAVGYLDRNEGNNGIDAKFANDLPKISGVATQAYPPVIRFSDDGFAGFGSGLGSEENKTTRPSYVANDLLTWVKGKHTLNFGGEYRNLGQNIHDNRNGSGTFNFARLTTGLLDVPASGSPIASFLLEAVSSANLDFRATSAKYPRGRAYVLHAGDTWKVTPKLSLNYGVRWDYFTPSWEKFNRLSFFDPLGSNPGAGGRPGRLAFAGDRDVQTGQSFGPAGFPRRYPEEPWRNGFAPRLGIAYAFRHDTVVRAGYGIFYNQAFYPGWGGGIAQDGFVSNVSFSSTLGGMQPAFILSQGLPAVPPDRIPPAINPAFRNGQGLLYRPFDANRRTYAQQWNLTIEHQFTSNFYISTAYVGNKGTRLPSTLAPLNALDPRLLSLGNKLFDEFKPGDTQVDGVPLPYPGWVEQMKGCAPSVAQALLPFPQFCSPLRGLNENAGNSTYHSFQFKAEKRFSNGTFLLASYTVSKLLTTTDHIDQGAGAGGAGGPLAAHGVISPFERKRNKGLATDDVPQILSLAFSYDVPFGKGKRWLNIGGPVGKIVEGWQLTSILRFSSGLPFFFRSKACTIPEQFRVGCIPAILPGADPLAQDKGSFDPTKPLLNKAAFEPTDRFKFYDGQGPRITNLRGFGYHNHNFGLLKDTRISERVAFQLRADFFNLWNWHIFNTSGAQGGGQAFVTDLANPDFGLWNKAVSDPRNVQVGARVTF